MLRDIRAGKEKQRKTLQGLEMWFSLYGSCFACPHYGVVNRYDLKKKFGERAILRQLEMQLVCTKCGNRHYNAFALLVSAGN